MFINNYVDLHQYFSSYSDDECVIESQVNTLTVIYNQAELRTGGDNNNTLFSFFGVICNKSFSTDKRAYKFDVPYSYKFSRG